RAAHRAHLALRQLQQVLIVEQHASRDDPPRRRHEPDQRERRHALPASGFADEPEDAPAIERERHAVDRTRDAVLEEEVHREAADVEEGGHRLAGALAASNGRTRPAGGGAKSVASSAGFSSTASYTRVACAFRPDDATSIACGNPSR